MENKTDPTLSDLSGKDNWEKRFRKLFFKNGEYPDLDDPGELWAGFALQWVKKYSPLNPRYEQPQEIKTT